MSILDEAFDIIRRNATIIVGRRAKRLRVDIDEETARVVAKTAEQYGLTQIQTAAVLLWLGANTLRHVHVALVRHDGLTRGEENIRKLMRGEILEGEEPESQR